MERPALPIDSAQPMSTQSVHALMIAEELGLLEYRMPIDMTEPAKVKVMLGELGNDMAMPEDPNGTYYLVYVRDGNGFRNPVLLAEGEPRVFVAGLAARAGRDVLQRVQYRWSILPVE